MKKWIIAIILIIVSSMGVACGKDPSISYAKSQIQINFDETYTIDEDDIEIKHSKKDCVISILDTDIAELDGFQIIPKKEGNTSIRFAIKGEDVYIDIPLIVTHIIYATNAEIEQNNIVININYQNDVFNRITLNEGCNEQPQVSYNKEVISYDYITGKIAPVAVGTTNVVVLYNACNVSFTVIIIDKVYTTAVEIEDHTIYVGNSGVFEYNVFPELANTYKFYSFSDKLQVSDNGDYVANSSGEVDVFVEYYTSENTPVVKTFKVNIKEEINNFDFSIKNTDNSECKYILKEKSYKLIISNVNNVSRDDIKVSNEFIIEDVLIGNDSVEVSGKFSNTGKQIVVIEITSNGNIVSSSSEYDVYQISDIKITAKWSIYNQQQYPDGKYHIKLEETPNYPSYLKFSLNINDVIITDTFKVYDVTNTKTEISKTFTPSSIGEYILMFEFMEEEIGNISIVVE